MMRDVILNFLLSVAVYFALVFLPFVATLVDWMFIYSAYRQWKARDFLICYVLYALTTAVLLIVLVPDAWQALVCSWSYYKDFARLCMDHGVSVSEVLFRFLFIAG